MSRFQISLFVLAGLALAACGSSGGGSTGGSGGSSGGSSGTSGLPSGALTTAVGQPVGAPPESVTLGAAGGSYTTADQRLTLTVPAGALSQDTRITITALENPVEIGVGYAYRLEPNGLTFAQPATLTLNPQQNDLSGTEAARVGLAFQRDDGAWQIVEGTTVDGQGRISTPIAHFTDYTWYANMFLTGLDHLFVSAATELAIETWDPPPVDAEGFTLLPSTKHAVAPQGQVTWKVNGNLVGSPADGQVDPVTAATATYTAPAQVPSGDPVAVSATFQAPDGSTATLVDNVHVLAHVYRATLAFDTASSCSGTGGNDTDVQTTASIDLTLDSSFHVTGSNPSAPVTPTCSAASCNASAYSETAQCDQTPGMELTGASGSWDKNRKQLHVIFQGSWPDVPAYEIRSVGGQVSDSPASVQPDLGVLGYLSFFQGGDGEALHVVGTSDYGAGAVTFTTDFSLSVVTP